MSIHDMNQVPETLPSERYALIAWPSRETSSCYRSGIRLDLAPGENPGERARALLEESIGFVGFSILRSEVMAEVTETNSVEETILTGVFVRSTTSHEVKLAAAYCARDSDGFAKAKIVAGHGRQLPVRFFDTFPEDSVVPLEGKVVRAAAGELFVALTDGVQTYQPHQPIIVPGFRSDL